MNKITETDLDASGKYNGWLGLTGYAHSLPEGLTSVGGTLILIGYAHPLPPGLAHRDTRKKT